MTVRRQKQLKPRPSWAKCYRTDRTKQSCAVGNGAHTQLQRRGQPPSKAPAGAALEDG